MFDQEPLSTFLATVYNKFVITLFGWVSYGDATAKLKAKQWRLTIAVCDTLFRVHARLASSMLMMMIIIGNEGIDDNPLGKQIVNTDPFASSLWMESKKLARAICSLREFCHCDVTVPTYEYFQPNFITPIFHGNNGNGWNVCSMVMVLLR